MRVGKLYYSDTTKRGAHTSVIVERSLINTWRDGPAVSFEGSPTVSPVTAALCASEPLPPWMPDSMNFFALSQAPPAVFKKRAIKTPVEVANMMKEAVHLAPSKRSSPPARRQPM